MVRASVRLSGLLILAVVPRPLSAQSAHPIPIRAAWAALGVDLHIAEDSYEVRGGTLADARRALDRHGPASADGPPSHALTTYQISTRWEVERTPWVCRVTKVHVSAHIRVHLPRWGDVRAASEEDFATWRKLEQELAIHEHAHRDLALAAAHRLVGDLANLEASSCPALDRLASAITTRVTDELSRAQKDLDAAAYPKPGRPPLPPGPGATARGPR